jgi:cytochrome c oxidase subunit II
VEVDGSYIERSIRTPQADVVDGYSPMMPSLGLSQVEIDDVAAYIRSLG